MTERLNLYAYTAGSAANVYPEYVSLNKEADGRVTLTVRSRTEAPEIEQASCTLPREALRQLAQALSYESLFTSPEHNKVGSEALSAVAVGD